ncbi:MAG: sugar phosphate isomerase/epimerase [Chloroflexi bacterium]|nr:sugar phosphate isomerase/epimerase [Chloroflexota bacterium]
MAYPPLGVQLIVFSGQTDLIANAADVLDAVKAAGFEAIECGVTMYAHAPEVFKGMLEARQLRVAGFHGSLDQDLDQTLRLMEIYGARDLCISNLGGWENTLAENYRRDLERLNEMGRICAQHGVRVHYHNHAYEFNPTDEGCLGIELILAEIDRSVVDLCVDVAWVHIAAHDPALFLRRVGDLVGYVHLKDYTGDRKWVELGYGVVPLDSVMRAIGELKRVRWVVYEQDTSDRPAAESCAISREYLRSTYGY